jgi:hypothetical protein
MNGNGIDVEKINDSQIVVMTTEIDPRDRRSHAPSLHVTCIEQVRSKETKEIIEARRDRCTVLINPIETMVKCHILAP